MIESILYKTDIYCSFSLDDESLRESCSIQTQKKMLEYAEQYFQLNIEIIQGLLKFFKS